MALFGRRKRTAPPPEIEADAGEPTVPLPDRPDTRPDGLRAMQDHRDYLLSIVSPLPPFGQNLLDAQGLALCEDLRAERNLPDFDHALVSGYAVMSGDLDGIDVTRGRPAQLDVIGRATGGREPGLYLEPGTAIRISAGAGVPDGCDAIVPIELTDGGEDTVRVFGPVDPGSHLSRAGDDLRAGTLLREAGSVLGPRDIGLLATAGIGEVVARPRPRVVVVSTGSDLVQPGDELRDGVETYDANSYLLAAAAKAAGAEAYRVCVAGQSAAEISRSILDQLVRADLIVVIGGTNQRDYDRVKEVLGELGPADFCDVSMQPGRPQGVALIGAERVPVIMVPGHPISAFVSYEAFVRPVLRRLMGASQVIRPALRCAAAHVIRSVPGKVQLARGVVTTDDEGQRLVSMVGSSGSHLLGDLARCDALIVLEAETTLVDVGQAVHVWMLDDEG